MSDIIERLRNAVSDGALNYDLLNTAAAEIARLQSQVEALQRSVRRRQQLDAARKLAENAEGGSTMTKEVRTIPGCEFAGPGRGDCEHFYAPCGPTDEYGKPKGWCWFCWHSYIISKLREQVAEETALRISHEGRVAELNDVIREHMPSDEFDRKCIEEVLDKPRKSYSA